MRQVAWGAALAIWLAAAAGADEMREVPLQFPPGASAATVTGQIAGYDSVVYVIGAEAGQRMTVALHPSNLSTYFNLYAPGRGPGDEALASGQMTGPGVPDLNRFDGVLPASGEYRLSVFQMRAAAREGQSSAYRLEVAITGKTGAVVEGDFADGLAGGPDFWTVTGASSLNLRAGPSAGAAAVGSAVENDLLRNLGCRMAEGRRWCHVELIGSGLRGWAVGSFLRESAGAPPLGQVPPPVPSDGMPPREERVTFAPGSSGSVLRGSLSAGEAVTFLLGARAGQTLVLDLTEAAPGLQVSVTDPSGATLFAGGHAPATFRSPLAAGGDLRVTLRGAAAAATAYGLALAIE